VEPKKIVIVDDEPDVLESIAFALEAEGYKVVRAADGYQGFGAVRMEEPDLVILDVMLPGKNGYEVARMLREDARKGAFRGCPILILTARKVDSAERQEFLETWSGADLHLYKPFELNALMEAVRTLIDD